MLTVIVTADQFRDTLACDAAIWTGTRKAYREHVGESQIAPLAWAASRYNDECVCEIRTYIGLDGIARQYGAYMGDPRRGI